MSCHSSCHSGPDTSQTFDPTADFTFVMLQGYSLCSWPGYHACITGYDILKCGKCLRPDRRCSPAGQALTAYKPTSLPLSSHVHCHSLCLCVNILQRNWMRHVTAHVGGLFSTSELDSMLAFVTPHAALMQSLTRLHLVQNGLA